MQISSVNQNIEILKTETSKKTEPVSVFDVVNSKQNDGAGESSPQSVIDKKLEEMTEHLAKKSKNYSKEDLLRFFHNCGIDLNEVASESPNDIDRFFEFWEKRILECKSIEDLYEMAIVHENVKKNGLAGLFSKYLSKSEIKHLNKVNPERLQEAVDKFINDQMAVKHEDTDEEKQMKIFMKILDATNDKDKALILKTLLKNEKFVKLANENQQVSKMLDMTMLSIAKSEDIQNFINQIPIEIFETLGLSKEETLKSVKLLAENGDLEYLEKLKEELKTKLDTFFNEHKETIDSIRQKIQAKQTELGRELSDKEVLDLLKDSPEELKLYQVKVTLKSIFEGYELGVVNSNNISNEQKKDITADVNNKLEEYGLSKEVLEEIKKYIQEHPEEFDGKLENITEILNSVTGGEFGEITNTNNNDETGYCSAIDSMGLYIQQITSEECKKRKSNIEECRNALPTNNTHKNDFTVEKNNALLKSNTSWTSTDIEEGIKSGKFRNAIDALSQSLSNFKNLAKSGQDWCMAQLLRMSHGMANYLLRIGVSDTVKTQYARNGGDIDDNITAGYYTMQQIKQIKDGQA